MCGVKAMTLYQLEERDSKWSQFDTKIASALGVPLHLLREGTDADIDAWLAQRKEGGEARGTELDQTAQPKLGLTHDPLEAVRQDVQCLPPELRAVLAQLVTEYITAPEERKSVLKEAIERLKGGGGYGRGSTASTG